MRRNLTKHLLAATVLLGIAAQPVAANTITPSLSAFPVPEAGNFRWIYDASESTNGRVSTGAAPGAVTVDTAEGLVADFFTIYDFVGFIAGSNLEPAGWAFQSLSTGSTNTVNVGTVGDDPSIPNLTWYWIGAVRAGPWTDLGFGVLSVFSGLASGDYSSEDTHNAPGFPGDGDTDEASGSITVPLPEPATTALFGLALLGLAAHMRRKTVN